jgi:hypothetical protein
MAAEYTFRLTPVQGGCYKNAVPRQHIAPFSLISLLFSVSAAAHSGRSVSYSDLAVRGSDLVATLRVSEEDLIETLSLDLDRDGRISPEEMRRGLTLVADYLRNNLVLHARREDPAGKSQRFPCAPEAPSFDPPPASDRPWRFRLTYRCGTCDGTPECPRQRAPPACAAVPGCAWRPVAVDDLDVRCTLFQGAGFSHRHQATARVGGVERVLLFDDRVTEETVAVPLLTQVGGYLLHGVHHIALGYDHLAFLFGLLLLGGTFRTLVKIVTSFTVAHSVTLLLGAFGVVALPGAVVESAIALTIAYIGIENLFLKTPEKRWIITFFLGLVHGFGFAGALAESGLPTKGFVLTLVSFNVGVEVGQIAVVALLWPALRWMLRQDWHVAARRALSGALAAMGLTLFVLRAFFDVS